MKRPMVLDPLTLTGGETTRIRIEPRVALGNDGGLITLLDPSGLKVDGVAYTKEQAGREGWTLVF